MQNMDTAVSPEALKMIDFCSSPIGIMMWETHGKYWEKKIKGGFLNNDTIDILGSRYFSIVEANLCIVGCLTALLFSIH